MSEKIFANGIYLTPKSEQTPEFILAKFAIETDKFIPFLKEHKNDKGYVYIDLCKSQGGKKYFQLNTFKPKPKAEETKVIQADDSFAQI